MLRLVDNLCSRVDTRTHARTQDVGRLLSGHTDMHARMHARVCLLEVWACVRGCVWGRQVHVNACANQRAEQWYACGWLVSLLSCVSIWGQSIPSRPDTSHPPIHPFIQPLLPSSFTHWQYWRLLVACALATKKWEFIISFSHMIGPFMALWLCFQAIWAF